MTQRELLQRSLILADSGHTKEAMGLVRGAVTAGQGLWNGVKAIPRAVGYARSAIKDWRAAKGVGQTASRFPGVPTAITGAENAAHAFPGVPTGVNGLNGAGFVNDMPAKGSWGSRLAGWGARNPDAAMVGGAGAMVGSNAATMYGTGRHAENKYNARGQEMVNAFQNSKDQFLENEGFNSFGGRLMNGLQGLLGGKQYANNLYDRYKNQYMMPQLSPEVARDFQRWTSAK